MSVRGVIRAAPLLVVAVILAVLPLLDVGTGGILPGTLGSPGSLQLLALCLVFGGLALSYDLLLGFTGLLSFGHALYFAAGVYTFDIALSDWNMGMVPALGVTAGVALVLPLLVGAVSLRTGGIAFAMVTLAFAQAGSIIVSRNPGGLTGGELGLSLSAARLPGALVGVVNTRNLYWIALGVLVVVYAATSFAVGSAPGRVWQAIRENERRVRVLGLRPYGFKLMAFVFASFLAAACGVVYVLLVGGAHTGVTTPEFTLSLLVMVVLGGTGVRWGAVLGGVIYTYLDQRLGTFAASGGIAHLPGPLRVPLSQPLLILGVIFILIVLFLPGGIAGTLTRARPAKIPVFGSLRGRLAGAVTPAPDAATGPAASAGPAVPGGSAAPAGQASAAGSAASAAQGTPAHPASPAHGPAPADHPERAGRPE